MQTLSNRDDSTLFLIWLMDFIDQSLELTNKDRPLRGRPAKLPDLEVLTILIYDSLVEKHATLRGVYNFIKREYSDCFKMPTYQNFVTACHRVIPLMRKLIKLSLIKDAKVIFCDSSPLSVCHPIRANIYKTLDKRSVGFTKNCLGYFFGFKLHVSINKEGHLVAIHISKASHHDRRHALKLINRAVEVLVGDSHYGGKPLVKELDSKGIRVVSNANKSLTEADRQLLRKRSKVESIIGVLKRNFGLETSHCRSKIGYLCHFWRIIMGYSFRRVVPSSVI